MREEIDQVRNQPTENRGGSRLPSTVDTSALGQFTGSAASTSPELSNLAFSRVPGGRDVHRADSPLNSQLRRVSIEPELKNRLLIAGSESLLPFDPSTCREIRQISAERVQLTLNSHGKQSGEKIVISPGRLHFLSWLGKCDSLPPTAIAALAEMAVRVNGPWDHVTPESRVSFMMNRDECTVVVMNPNGIHTQNIQKAQMKKVLTAVQRGDNLPEDFLAASNPVQTLKGPKSSGMSNQEIREILSQWPQSGATKVNAVRNYLASEFDLPSNSIKLLESANGSGSLLHHCPGSLDSAAVARLSIKSKYGISKLQLIFTLKDGTEVNPVIAIPGSHKGIRV